MNASFPVSLTSISYPHPEFVNDVFEVLSSYPYSDQEGFGFQEVQSFENLVVATLVKRIPTFIPQLNIDTGEISDREIFLYSKYKFGLDFKYNVLETYGAAQNASKTRITLRQVLSSQLKFTTLELNLVDIIKRLNEYAKSIVIDNLTVANFQHIEGVTGRYAMRISDFAVAELILHKYSHDILKASLQVISSPLGNFTLHLSKASTIKIVCNEQQFSSVFSYVKSVIIGGEQNG